MLQKTELSVIDECVLLRSIPPEGTGHKYLMSYMIFTQGYEQDEDVSTCICTYVWWPNLDKNIKQLAKHCTNCFIVSLSSPKAPIHHWEWPAQPWSRLHLDFTGPFLGHMYT